MKKYLYLALVLLAGCTSATYHGGTRKVESPNTRIFLPPFANATDDEHAGRALTEMTATALYDRGFPVVQSEAALTAARGETAAGTDGLFAETARSVQATHLLIGTVHEYRYKTDLDGDPAVGVSMRLVDANNGLTVWQGSSANVDVFFASLSRAAQYSARKLVAQIPVHHTNHVHHPRASAPAATNTVNLKTP